MTGKKQLKIARTLFKNSQTSQLVDAKKVRSNIDLLSTERPRKLISILRAYKRLSSEALAKEEAQVESALPLTNQKQFTAFYFYILTRKKTMWCISYTQAVRKCVV